MDTQKKNTMIKMSQYNSDNLHLPDQAMSFKTGPDQKQSTANQHTYIPYYSDHPLTESERKNQLMFCTREIKFNIMGCGVPKINEKYRPTDDKCDHIWVPLGDDCGNGAKLLRNLVGSMDEKYTVPINSGTMVLKSNVGKVLKNLCYSPIIREASIPDGYDEDKEGPWTPWLRMNVKFESKPNTDGSGLEKMYDVDIRLPDGSVIHATTIAEIRKYLRYGCTAKLGLKVKTFWVLKTQDPKSKTYSCGFKIVCNMIDVTELSTFTSGGGQQKPSWGDMVDDDDDDDDNAVSKPTKRNTRESDDDEPKPKLVKKPTKKQQESDDDEPEVKPVKKPTKKQQDSDDDEPEVKPVKKPTKKQQDSDDDSSESESEEEEVKPLPKKGKK